MSINKLVSIKNPIIDAWDMLNIDHDKDLPVFVRWATQAENQIGSYYQYEKKHAVLDIVNCHACLPKDAKYVQRAVLGDLGCGCSDIFNTLCSTISLSSTTINASAAGSFLIVDMGTGYTQVFGSIPHEIQNNKIILNTSDYDGQKLTIQYLGYKTDCDGFIMVNENHVEAIANNLCWKYLMRKRNLNGYEYGKMKEYKFEWHNQAGNARAKDSELTESSKDLITAMLSDPYIGYGVELETTFEG